MQAIKEYYLDKLSRVHEDTESFRVIKTLINEHFEMIEHMKTTSLYDVYMYEKDFAKNNFEPFIILANENEDLKKEINELRKKLGLGMKYKTKV